MPYRIEAQLLQGGPRLRLFDAASGALRLQWRYRTELMPGSADRPADGAEHFCAARANLQALLRDLFLLSCADNTSLLIRTQAADVCAYCDQCLSGVHAADDRSLQAARILGPRSM
jgi:hypothetical protein